MAPPGASAPSPSRSRRHWAQRSLPWRAPGTSTCSDRSARITSSTTPQRTSPGAGSAYDFILDNVSNRSLTDLRRALTPTGMLIPNGGNFGNRWFSSAGRLVRAAVLFRFGDQRLGRFLVSMNHADLVVLKDLIETGKVRPRPRPHIPAERHRAGDGPRRPRACPGKGRDHRVMRRPAPRSTHQSRPIRGDPRTIHKETR